MDVSVYGVLAPLAGGVVGKIAVDIIYSYFIARDYVKQYGDPQAAEREFTSRFPPDVEFISRPARRLAYRLTQQFF